MDIKFLECVLINLLSYLFALSKPETDIVENLILKNWLIDVWHRRLKQQHQELSLSLGTPKLATYTVKNHVSLTELGRPLTNDKTGVSLQCNPTGYAYSMDLTQCGVLNKSDSR